MIPRIILIILALWLWVASVAWQFRNPTGNSTTFWTEFPHAIRFEKLDKYQARP